MSLPEELTAGLDVTQVTPVHGGDIARAYRLDTSDGPVFLKTHPSPTHLLFEREARGLRALREAAPTGLRVPEVLASSPSGLVLEWIDEGRRSSGTEAALGAGLAALHHQPQPHFGGLDGDESGYLGSVEVDLTPTSSWPEFYLERRVRPLARRAVDEGQLPAEALRLVDSLAPRASELCGPDEPPSLVHGDLWAGNRLVSQDGANWLIDPAAHYAHREFDLAMMALFGGFGREAFTSYDDAYPLAGGWQERIPWYQLTPLLVHAILFGGGYGASVMSVLRNLA
ncbi:MAG: fructosamine kinase family protein [Propionibacterium sp.]|nr:fructosamine kinase family protein [Propionibacterium sp.]